MFFNANTDEATLGDIFDDSNGDSVWQQIFNPSVGLASQIIAALGKRPTQQIGVNGVTALPNVLGQTGYYGTGLYGQTQQYPYGGASQNVGSTVGNTLGSGLDGIFNWVVANPLVTGAFALGAYLLFREPPRRR